MFVNIIHFPPIREGKDAEFREWFTWSNAENAKHKEFISRNSLQRDRGAALNLLDQMIRIDRGEIP